MGFFSEDMAPMLGVYEAETSELMASIDAIVSRVEREKAFSHEDIAELFRCAHTVKGSSAMMGLDSLASLTHKVEDLFSILRGDPSLAEGHVADILDYLYSFSDYVKDEIGRMEDDDFAPTDADNLISEVASFAATLAGGNAADVASESVHNENAQIAAVSAPETAEERQSAEIEPETEASVPANSATLKVSFKPDIPMVNARALVIVKQLSAQVSVHSYVPDDLANAEAAQVISKDGLLVIVDAPDTDKAKEILAKNSFIRRISVLDEVAPTSSAQGATGKVDKIIDSPAGSDKYITLRWSSVRDLQDMVGEFLLHIAYLKSMSQKMSDESGMRTTVAKTARLVEELAYHVDKMAMVSMSAMVPQLSRMVRDMCRNSGKQVSFEVHGGDIEIDRNLYNSISEPLLHIIRNAVDHGIEAPDKRLALGKEARGKVELSVENLGARVAFRVSDDGRGIDVDKVLAKAEANGQLDRPKESYSRAEVLRMVMLAGLSTSKEVTQYSGRGVGMDVVDAVVRDFNGRLEIESEPGSGTSMMLFMPVSVTSVESLCFRIGPSVYQMPLHNLNKIFTIHEAKPQLSSFEGSTLLTFEKRQLPVLDMHQLLNCPGEIAFYIVCHSMDDEFVIGVDEIMGDYSCANKPLPTCLDSKWQELCPIRNVAIMDDGTVGYVLNAALLAALAQGRRQMPKSVNEHDGAEVDSISPEVAMAVNMPAWAFVFALGDDWYALAIDLVERLSPLLACAPTPRSMPYLMGLSNYRNQAIAVFDLAKSAGIEDESQYVLIVADDRGEYVGLTISAAIGVRDLNGAVLAEDQPEPRSFAYGLHSAALIKADPKDPPITLLVKG